MFGLFVKIILLKFLLVSLCNASLSQYNGIMDCLKRKADIFFLVDRTGDLEYFRDQLALIVGLTQTMEVGPNCARVGVILYSHSMTLFIDLNNNMNLSTLQTKIYAAPIQAPKNAKDGDISKAIKGLREIGLTPTVWRPDVPHISVLITDDSIKTEKFDFTFANANLAKRAGIYMFTLSVGDKIPYGQLARLSSEPDNDFVFNVSGLRSISFDRTPLLSKISGVLDRFIQDENATCRKNEPMDVLFLFDEVSYGRDGSQKIRSFLQNISHDLRINSGHVRVGIKSMTHTGEIKWNQHSRRECLIQSLKASTKPDIAILLQYAWEKVFGEHNLGRASSKQRLVVFLHKDLSANTEVRKEFHTIIRSQTIEVFIVYTNKDYNKKKKENNIAGLAGSKKSNVLRLSSVNKLLSEKEAFLKMFCQE